MPIKLTLYMRTSSAPQDYEMPPKDQITAARAYAEACGFHVVETVLEPANEDDPIPKKETS